MSMPLMPAMIWHLRWAPPPRQPGNGTSKWRSTRVTTLTWHRPDVHSTSLTLMEWECWRPSTLTAGCIWLTRIRRSASGMILSMCYNMLPDTHRRNDCLHTFQAWAKQLPDLLLCGGRHRFWTVWYCRNCGHWHRLNVLRVRLLSHSPASSKQVEKSNINSPWNSQ